jgi:hypothetical protein
MKRRHVGDEASLHQLLQVDPHLSAMPDRAIKKPANSAQGLQERRDAEIVKGYRHLPPREPIAQRNRFHVAWLILLFNGWHVAGWV